MKSNFDPLQKVLTVTRSAEFSEDGIYRYILSRDWDNTQPVAMCIGLNPSNADAEKDDPTIRILIKNLSHLGFGGLRMLNLYALVSSKPKKLFEVPDAIGLNDAWLKTTAFNCQVVIFCWGSFKGTEWRVKKVSEMFPFAKCFGFNKDGTPMHPMALMYSGTKPADVKLISYSKL
jgi:hypothetical protein